MMMKGKEKRAKSHGGREICIDFIRIEARLLTRLTRLNLLVHCPTLAQLRRHGRRRARRRRRLSRRPFAPLTQ